MPDTLTYMDGVMVNGHEIMATNVGDSMTKPRDAEIHQVAVHEGMIGANTGSATESENANATGSDTTREGIRIERDQLREKKKGDTKMGAPHPGALRRRVPVRLAHALNGLDRPLGLDPRLPLTRQSPILHRLVFLRPKPTL